MNLIDGSIAGSAGIATNTTTGSTTNPPDAQIGTISTNTSLTGKTFTLAIAGQPDVTFTFGTATGDVGVGATNVDSASNLASALNNSGLSELANFRFTSDSSGNVFAYYTGQRQLHQQHPVTDEQHVRRHHQYDHGLFHRLYRDSYVRRHALTPGDSVTIGSHVIDFGAFDTNTVAGYALNSPPTTLPEADLGNTGGTYSVTAGAVANLASLLNAAGYTDLAGVTFKAGGTNNLSLIATYSGTNATPPTISTFYTSATPDTLTGAR